jgi:hypothetical protein
MLSLAVLKGLSPRSVEFANLAGLETETLPLFGVAFS